MAADVLDRYLEAAKAGDLEALADTLAGDVELVSPLSGRMVFRGRDELCVLLGVVYGSLRDVQWNEQIRDGDRAVVLGESRVGLARRSDVTVYEIGADGRIRRIRPYIRPWLGLTVDALVVAPRMLRHLPVVWRALRAGT